MGWNSSKPNIASHYDEEEVLLGTTDGSGVRLAGTLTSPQSGTKMAAVLLIPGSGSHDRDEQLAGHRPFLFLLTS